MVVPIILEYVIFVYLREKSFFLFVFCFSQKVEGLIKFTVIKAKSTNWGQTVKGLTTSLALIRHVLPKEVLHVPDGSNVVIV